MLWFHRKRMERPFFARSHSRFDNNGSITSKTLSEGDYPCYEFQNDVVLNLSFKDESNRRYMFELTRLIFVFFLTKTT